MTKKKRTAEQSQGKKLQTSFCRVIHSCYDRIRTYFDLMPRFENRVYL